MGLFCGIPVPFACQVCCSLAHGSVNEGIGHIQECPELCAPWISPQCSWGRTEIPIFIANWQCWLGSPLCSGAGTRWQCCSWALQPGHSSEPSLCPSPSQPLLWLCCLAGCLLFHPSLCPGVFVWISCRTCDTSLNECLCWGIGPLCVFQGSLCNLQEVFPSQMCVMPSSGYFTALCKDFPGNSMESSPTSLLPGCLGIVSLPNPGGGSVFELFAVLSPYHKKLNRTPGMPFMLDSLIGHWRNCEREKLMCCRFV